MQDLGRRRGRAGIGGRFHVDVRARAEDDAPAPRLQPHLHGADDQRMLREAASDFGFAQRLAGVAGRMRPREGSRCAVKNAVPTVQVGSQAVHCGRIEQVVDHDGPVTLE